MKDKKSSCILLKVSFAATNHKGDLGEIEYFEKILSSVSLKDSQFQSMWSDVCTLFLRFGGNRRKWIVEIQMAEEAYLLKISFAGKLNGDLVDIHADNRFDKQYYHSGFPLVNTKQIIVNNRSIKLILEAFPPNLQRVQLGNYRSAITNIFCGW